MSVELNSELKFQVTYNSPEGIIAVLSGKVEVLGSSLGVGQLHSCEIKIWDRSHTVYPVAMELCPCCQLSWREGREVRGGGGLTCIGISITQVSPE